LPILGLGSLTCWKPRGSRRTNTSTKGRAMDQTSQATDSSVTDVATQQSRRYPSSAEVEAAFTSSYTRYQYSFVELFAEHVAAVCRTFSGDMQMAVLLATVGQVTLRAALAAEAADEAIDRLPPARRGITAHRLADAT